MPPQAAAMLALPKKTLIMKARAIEEQQNMKSIKMMTDMSEWMRIFPALSKTANPTTETDIVARLVMNHATQCTELLNPIT